jgi:tetratricopeptide (TPR) repeat protein
VERTIIGAQGEAFALTPIQRVLLAGRVVWFYFGKLLWPANLIFVYPRWEIRPDLWWSYLFPLSAVAATIAGVLYSRKYGRGPLAATLFFVGTLFPVLGFVNVFPFLFSYVADHFQYVAGIGIVVGMTAAATLLLRRAPLLLRRGLSGVLLATLGVLTWRQCRTYGDVRTLYVTTLRANPRAWMAHHNLAVIDHRAGLFGDAMDHFDAAMKIYPQSADLNYDYANLLVALGRRTEAIDYYQRTVKLRPSYASAYHNLGLALAADGNHQQAIEEFRTAIRFDPRNPRVHNSLATSLFVLGQRQSAMEEYLRALELDPTFPEAHYNLGLRLDEAGQIEQAMNQYRLALKFRPGYVKARDHLNSDLARQGQP